MNRFSPLVWIGVNLLLGLGLYETKYAVQRLEDDRVRVDRQMALDEAQIHVLQAEWSYLRQPGRLADLAARHLNLQPLTAAQEGSFDSLPLKGDDPQLAAAHEVSVDDLLKAMQVAAAPAPAPAKLQHAAAKPGGVE